MIEAKSGVVKGMGYEDELIADYSLITMAIRDALVKTHGQEKANILMRLFFEKALNEEE